MKAYCENQPLNRFILPTAVGLTLLGTAITADARDVFDETKLIVGIQWNFRPDSLALVTNLQSGKVTSSGVMRGWQTKLRVGPDATFHGMSIEWFKGDRRIQPTWGVGYNAQFNTAQFTGGLQSKYLYSGVSYALNRQWDSHIGITPFGSFSKYRVRAEERVEEQQTEKKVQRR